MTNREIPIRGYGIDEGSTVSLPPHPRDVEATTVGDDIFEVQAEATRAAEEPRSARVMTAPRQERQQEPTPRQTRDGKRFPRVRTAGRIATVGLMAVGALSIANQFGDFDLPFGSFFDHGQTTVTGGISDIKTDVPEYSGKVTAEINSTVDIDVVRSLSNFGVVYCVEAVHENALPLNGLLVANTGNIKVTPVGKRVEAHILAFDAPELALPIKTPILAEPGDNMNVCTQKDPGKFNKGLSDKAFAKRRKIKEDSPENVPIVLAAEVLDATSKRIGDCVLNKANDEGSDVNKLLSMTIAKDIANDRGISPKDVDVYFDFKDTNEGVKALNDVKDKIIKEQKAKTDAEVKIDIEKAVNCDAHDISVMLSSNKPK